MLGVERLAVQHIGDQNLVVLAYRIDFFKRQHRVACRSYRSRVETGIRTLKRVLGPCSLPYQTGMALVSASGAAIEAFSCACCSLLPMIPANATTLGISRRFCWWPRSSCTSRSPHRISRQPSSSSATWPRSCRLARKSRTSPS